MIPWIDVNVWNGQFPFRRIAGTTIGEIEEHFGRLGFGAVAVAAMEAVFQEDAYAAEEDLARDLQARPGLLQQVWHMKVVNPTTPAWERDLDRAKRTLGIAGLRLCPTFHRYRLDHPAIAEVISAANSLDLPLQIMCKMQDWRLEWLLHTQDVEFDQVAPFLERAPACKLLLSGLHVGDMLRLAPLVDASPRLLLDCSRLKGPWRTFEKLSAAVAPRHLCFGSLWPINLPECPLTQLQHADLAPEIRAQILAENARDIFPSHT